MFILNNIYIMNLIDKITLIFGQNFTSYVFNITSMILFTFGLTVGSENPHLNFAQINVYRGIAGIIINYIIAKQNNLSMQFFFKNSFMIITKRNLLMAMQGIGFAFSLRYLQPSIVYNIGNIGPIVVFIMDIITNKRQVPNLQLIGIITSLLGLILTVNSKLLFYYIFNSDQFKSNFGYHQVDISIQILISIIFFLIIIGWAKGVMLTRQLKVVSAIEINLHLSYTFLIINVFINFFIFEVKDLSILQNIANVIWVGAPLVLSSLLSTKAIQITKRVGITSMLGFTSVILGYGISIFRYGEQINIFGLCGSIMILMGLATIMIK